jgi:hypothetical protein
MGVQQVKDLCHLALALTREVKEADLRLTFVALIHHHLGLRMPMQWRFTRNKDSHHLLWAVSLIETHQEGVFNVRSVIEESFRTMTPNLKITERKLLG